MAAITVTAKVRKGGFLALPKEACDQLKLQVGDEVDLQVEVPAAAVADPEANPLYGTIGLGKAGRADGAENHDHFLYGKK